jgi:DNA-binding SARP family transcriptional activator
VIGFGILGPAEVRASAGKLIAIGGTRQRTVLAMLLIAQGRVVSVDALLDAVWNGRPPATGRSQVAICVAGLRRAVKEGCGVEDVIVTAHPGYRVDPATCRIDAADFEELLARGRAAVAAGRAEEAVELLGGAVGLWRGPALAGIGALPVEQEAARLDELRLDAREELAAARLALGQQRELIPELQQMLAEQPLRERTRGQLMTAQFRSGRRVEALETYRVGRRLLVDELGLEPGPELSALHERILRGEDAAEAGRVAVRVAAVPAAAGDAGAAAGAAPAAPDTPPSEDKLPPTPAQLPPDATAFTGRAGQLAALDGLLPDRDGASEPVAPGLLPVGLVTGVAGVGKTGLVVHWAHRAAEHFPDGLLFADLRGYEENTEPTAPGTVLDRFLRALGVPATAVPADLGERAAMFRSLLDGRRVLVVLDNVRSSVQVLPLLPGNGPSCVLVTSRDPLDELSGEHATVRLRLSVLEEAEAVALLGRVAGGSRIAEDPEGAAELGRLCDRLPIALRIAGARLGAKPHWSVRRLVSRLDDESRRLDELSMGERRVRAGFEVTHRDLPSDTARLFRLLGLLDVADFAAWTAAALLDTDLDEAEELLEQLVDAQLLRVVDPGPVPRYRFLDLLRLFARELAHAREPEEQRRAALERAFGGWLALAEAAQRAIYGAGHAAAHGGFRRWTTGGMPSPEADPLAWFEGERAALTGAVEQAAGVPGFHRAAWELVANCVGFFEIRNYRDDWALAAVRALGAARSADDPLGEAVMDYGLGTLALIRREYPESAKRLGSAVELFAELGGAHGRALALAQLALVDWARGQVGRAADACTVALRLLGTEGAADPYARGRTLALLGQMEVELGRPEEGLARARAAVAESLEHRLGRLEAQTRYRLGEVLLGQDDPLDGAEQAAEEFGRMLALVRGSKDGTALAHGLNGLAAALLLRGRREAADDALTEALPLAREAADRLIEAQLELESAWSHLAAARFREAEAAVGRSGGLFDALGARAWAPALERAREFASGRRAPTVEELAGVLRLRVRGGGG